MSLPRRFKRLMDELLERRTAAVRGIVLGREQGAPKRFTKKIRDRLRRELLETVSHLLVRRRAKKEFEQLVVRGRLRRLSGLGHLERFDSMFQWAQRKLRGPIWGCPLS